MVDGEQTNTIDDNGNKSNKPIANTQENISKLDKLKAHNDAIEKELIRGRELKAESQRLESEKLLGGEVGGNVPVKEPKEETPMEYRARIDKEIMEGKYND